jgi:outer membrane protein OmpU
MKKILLATTILVGTAGFAAAEVALSGDARMGLINDGDTTALDARARVTFTMSGETDGGLSFGASFRADTAVDAAGGTEMTEGSVNISGAFGTLAMGSVDTAAQAMVGQVDGVGYTGLDDKNEVAYIGKDGETAALYTYSAGAVTFGLSTSQIAGANEASAVGVSYAADTYKVALGYEDNGDGLDHIIVGGSATFAGVALKAIYGSADGFGDEEQYAISATYSADALSATVFYNEDFTGETATGLGASYALGGGATVAGGAVRDSATDDTTYDLGVNFSF